MTEAIILKNVSKKYFINKKRPMLIKSLFQQKKDAYDALKNITLSIKKGESVGIIGANGAGKSTLLKLIAGITSPTKGSVKVFGKVASLIELGAGFHPDLTGRENVYLNATLLGMTKKEIDEKYAAIVAFADIGNYIDEPVRTYSSGMIVRLGFSVAIHLDPDILLIDEVLAVGDGLFQRKCIDTMRSLKSQGKTILFVTHNLTLIQTICKKTILIEKSKIAYFGNTIDALRTYSKNSNTFTTKGNNQRWGTGKMKISSIATVDNKGKQKNTFSIGESMHVRMRVHATTAVQDPIYGIIIRDNQFQDIFQTNTLWLGVQTGHLKKNDARKVLFMFEQSFPDGIYFITPGIASYDIADYHDWIDNAYSFEIRSKNNHVSINPKHTIVIQENTS